MRFVRFITANELLFFLYLSEDIIELREPYK
jgi:hypothetical protein